MQSIVGETMFEIGISTPQDLIKYKHFLETERKNINAYLVNDINMSGIDWTPINPQTKEDVLIEFNGNGHSIYGLYSCPIINNKSLYRAAVNPCGAGEIIYVKPTGLLFNYVPSNLTIKNLCLNGKLNLDGIKKNNYTQVAAGGLVGVLQANNFTNLICKIENCRIDVDIKCPDQKTSPWASALSKIGGIVGANSSGIIQNCIYTGDINRASKAAGAGVAYYNSGFIKNCYDKERKYPVVGNGNYKIVKGTAYRHKYNDGITDNIDLFMPGGPYCTNRIEDFWKSEMLRKIVDNDVVMDWNVKQSYWYKDVICRIAQIIESMGAQGAKFGPGDLSAPALSVLPFANSKYTYISVQKTYQYRYNAMLRTLIEQSPSFRRSFIEEFDRNYEGTMIKICNYSTSEKSVETILRKAHKHEAYHQSVAADIDYIEATYER